MKRAFGLLCAAAGLSGCASFSDALVGFNQRFDRFNAAFDREKAQQDASWGIVESVTIVQLENGASPGRTLQKVVVRSAGTSGEFRVMYLPIAATPYQRGATLKY